MDDKNKKGFAGFSQLASDEVIDVPKSDETETETTPHKVTNTEPKQNFFGNFFKKKEKAPQPAKPSDKKGNYWWLLLPLIAVFSHLNDNDKKPETKVVSPPPAVVQHTVTPQPVQQPAPAQVDEFAGIPMPLNYHPHIQPYKPTAVLDEYHRIEDAGDEITPEVFKKFSSMAQSNMDAQYVEALFTKYGKGTPKDEKKGNFMLLVSAQNDHPDGLRDASFQFDGMLRVDYLMRAALLGDPAAQFLVGQNYYNGKIIEQDYNKALYWFVKSAEQQYPGAQLGIGVMYLSGEGMPKDVNKAFVWIMKAARQLNPAACAIAAGLYADDSNEVVKQDLGKSFFYSTCADQSDEDTQKLRARITPQMKVADYETAAELGSREAMFEAASDNHLGILVPKDNFKAEKFISMYGRKGPEQQKLADQIEAEMSPDDIQRAQSSGQAWIDAFLIRLNQSSTDFRNAYDAARTEPFYGLEIIPSVGTYPDLDQRGLRWCVYRRKTVDYINHQIPDDKNDKNELANENVKYVTPAITAKMDAIISDYNSRCPSGRQYLQRDMDTINSELRDPIYNNQIALAAQQIMLSWDRRFWFRE